MRSIVAEVTSPIAWLDWSAEAFQRASAERKPILLAIGASWCPWSAEMARTTYADAGVAALVADRFIPIRVDADRRPDVSDRYALGGWPTTAFLTPAGDVLGGATFLTPGQLAPILEKVAVAWDELRLRPAAIVSGAAERQSRALNIASPGGHTTVVDEGFTAWLCERMVEAFDDLHGGFGSAPKLIYADSLRAAIQRWLDTRDPRLERIVTRTLDGIAGGDLWDDVNGGCFRYADARDWSGPHREKLLSVHAGLLRLYLEAWQAFARPEDRSRAIAIVRYVHGTLADPVDGGFHASQRDDLVYYALPAENRPAGGPAVDRSLYGDANGLMAAAYADAAHLLDDGSLMAFAARSLDRILLAGYERGGGVAHEAGAPGSIRGLLADQVYVAAALVDVHDATGQPVYLDMAMELMAYALRHLWDGPAGGFMDRVRGGPGEASLLREPLKPFAANCEAARTLARLARVAEKPELGDRAIQTLASQTSVARSCGLHAGPYALALREVMHSGH